MLQNSTQSTNKINKANDEKKTNYWYWMLLASISMYVAAHRDVLGELDHWNVYNLMFLVWLFLLIFPLISEMEFLGVKIKREVEKEVEKSEENCKERISQLQQQILGLQMSNTVNFYPYKPSDDETSEFINSVDQNYKEKIYNSSEDNYDFSYVDEDNVFLFKCRLNIEILLRKIYEKSGYSIKTSVYEMVDDLLKREIISPQIANYIRQIQKLTSKGVHGEVLEERIKKSIKSIYPDVVLYLKNLQAKKVYAMNNYFMSCSRCGYRGFSNYDNVCPRCGFVSDDE